MRSIFEKQLFLEILTDYLEVDLVQLSAGRTRIEILQGDITEQSTEAIVNAANSSLIGGGGVDGAIHRKGGACILEECEKIRSTLWKDGLPTGKAAITSAGGLKARYVIHTVGPIWRGGHSGEPKELADCYHNSLALAASKDLRSIAFPSISTGAYGYPMKLASKVALNATRDFLIRTTSSLEEVLLVLFATQDLRIYEDEATNIWS